MKDRPNILLITSDQQRGDALGIEGRPVQTPHLDALAMNGTRFTTCITANPVCMPSRASILTGLLPLTHGVWDNGVDLRQDVAEKGFAGRLSAEGYHTALIGKAHFSTYHTFSPTGRPECWTSSGNYSDDWNGPYMGFDEVQLGVAPHYVDAPPKPPLGLHYDRWFYRRGDPEQMASLTQEARPPITDATQTRHSPVPPAWHNSTWCADQTIEFLRRNQDTPFVLWSSFPDPHHPFDAPLPWSKLHEPSEVDLPTNRTQDLDRRPWWHRASLESTPQLADDRLREFRSQSSRVPQQSDKQLADLIANYYGMVSLIDHNVGRIITELHELGLADNTYIIFTSDHGDWLGDHGLVLKGPIHYEGLIRVPLLMSGPGLEPGRVIDSPVSTVDLFDTILEWSGCQDRGYSHGRSLQGLVDGTSEPRHYAYCEWNVHPSRCGVGLELRTIRTRSHKLTLECSSGAAEMYDLDQDPDEMANVADDPGYLDVRRELEARIHERPDDSMDVLAAPVGMA